MLLQRGAARVYAVDVGRGQLAESLRRDERVVSMERMNARTLTATTLPEPIDLAVVDVSFISLGLVLGPIASTLRPGPGAAIVALVKPQFEAGRGRTDHGVVRDPAVHREVLERVVETGARARARRAGVIASPILGPEGNREFLVELHARCRLRRPRRSDRGGDRPVTIRRIGFAYNPTSEAAVELRERAAGWCAVRGIDQWAAQAGDFEALCADLPTTDVLVVLGGDGTFLRAARAVIEVDVPLLGINLGKVGFLSKAEATELEAVLAQLVAGEFTIDERMALEARILPGGRETTATVAPRAQRRRDRPRRAGPGLPARRRDRAVAPGDVHRRRPRRLEPDRLDRLLVQRRRPGRRPAEPQPDRHPDRRLPVGDPLGRREPAARPSAAASSTRTRRSSASTAARTCRSSSATSSRSGRSSGPIRLVEPAGALPFWDLFRRKVELLPS